MLRLFNNNEMNGIGLCGRSHSFFVSQKKFAEVLATRDKGMINRCTLERVEEKEIQQIQKDK